ncbi:MAG TPA: DUF6452 family protein [Flavobacterium sp.]|jgi:hypothetical protein
MKKIIALLLAVFGFVFSGCEKDDICADTTPTTPRMVIEFYNFANRAELKPVTNLKVLSGLSQGLAFNNVSSITVPLRTTGDSTEYRFVLNAGNPNPALVYIDELQFNYTRRDVFVSRACGYKTLYDLNDDDDPETPEPTILNTTPGSNSGNWIKDIVIENYNIENEDEVHVKIYF